MKRWALVFGIAGAISGILSFTPFAKDFAWGALKPVSATLLIAAFIGRLLAPEYAKHAEDQRHRLSRPDH